ncbi:MAG: cell division protein FtsQ/DivIB [Gammaproteobacteria bacterium]|nr:cell division protein FtsQ/DivIB [Gammaproteobacteria bacterium]
MHSRIRRLIGVSLMLALVVSGWKLMDYDFDSIAPIKKVEIEGEFENISHDVFREHVVAVIDGGYFSLDLDAMRTALMELPWVDDVSVRRQWPSGIHIKVTEKTAVAYWNDDALISDHGDVFKPDFISQQFTLPKLNGPDGSHNKMWRFLVAINKDFSVMGFKVVDLNLDDRRAWGVHFVANKTAEKIQLKLGRNHADERLSRFIRVFSSIDKFDLKNIVAIDLRYPNGFAMRIKNNSASKHELVKEA